MGQQKSSACYEGICLFFCLFLISFFVRSGARFFVPTRNLRTPSSSGLSRHGLEAAVCEEGEAQRPPLTAPARDGVRKLRVGTIRGEPAAGRDNFAPQPCIRWITRARTMMHSCASASEAPRRRTHSAQRHESHAVGAGPRHLEPSSVTLATGADRSELSGDWRIDMIASRVSAV